MGAPEIANAGKPDREVHGQETAAYGPECAMLIEQTLARTIRPHHVGGGGIVDVESLWPDFESKIPYHVLRILHGSSARPWPERPDRRALREIVTDGNPILLSEDQYQTVVRIAEKVRKDMVEAMGGKITVDTRPGRGTTFILHLKAGLEHPLSDDGTKDTAD